MPVKQAFVLAAGFGTRLRPKTLTCPKPLIPVRGLPLLDHILNHLSAFGITKIVINTHHLAEHIHHHVRNRSGIHISHEDPEILGTGGGIKKGIPFFEGHPFFVVNADTYWEGTLGETLEALHRAWCPESMDALLALVPRHISGQNGDYERASSGHLHFRGTNAGASYTYTGLSLLHPRLFEGAPKGPYCLVKEIFHRAESQRRLFGLEHTGPWSDVGTHAVLEKLQDPPTFILKR